LNRCCPDPLWPSGELLRRPRLNHPSGGRDHAAGVGAGALSTAIYATAKNEPVVISAPAWGGGIGIGAAILIGALAGLWPALRAARLSPTQALWSV
jgi:hypothetical protein